MFSSPKSTRGTSGVLGPALGWEPGQARQKATACNGFWLGLRGKKPKPSVRLQLLMWSTGRYSVVLQVQVGVW